MNPQQYCSWNGQFVNNPPPLPLYLYHYSTLVAQKHILRTGVCVALGPNQHGVGVYFTSKPPQTSTRELVVNNYGYNATEYKRGSRTEAFIAIPSHCLPYVQRIPSSRDIWRNPHSIYLQGVEFFVGQRDGYGNIVITGKWLGHYPIGGGLNQNQPILLPPSPPPPPLLPLPPPLPLYYYNYH